MSIWVDLAKVSTGVNVLLLLVLGYIWGRNYLKFRSKHTLGLLIFSIFLLAENALVLYYYLVDPTLSGWWHDQVSPVWRAQMIIHGLQTLGLAFLVWVSWD
ncbi:hypothetical protein [Haloarchaeobius iranensis]|uniref:Uncharacterized protein n=1 Tax=Haloarchaeobius iranensis TaxID=996166 RepID=A0A1G9U9E8_9EURY|nr:hypothetical protein [Haloarchaeobius iranensis]SDM56571.1 hypothetical protein SAMN05192554_1048 [Haloarchaeobius iranensis]